MHGLKRVSVFLLLLLLLTAGGCVDRFPIHETDLYTGDPISPEMIDSIFDAISVAVTEKYPTESDENGELIVYWLEGGSVWHASKGCGNVLRAEPDKLKSGSIKAAYSAGKERACKICSSKLESDISVYANTDTPILTDRTDKSKIDYPKIYDTNGELIVYWLANGNVWHESAECRTVLNADLEKLYTGTANQAYEAGKTRPCKVCSADSDTVIELPETTVQTVEMTVNEETEAYPKEYDQNGELIVYWLENGSVWHESSSCGTVLKSDADKLHTGSAYQAYEAGKTRPCKVCSADSDTVIVLPETTVQTVETTVNEETEAYPKEYDQNGELIVYWLENGSVWHESSSCGTVLKADSEKLHIGTAYQAYEAGKKRACKVCGADSNIVIAVPETTENMISSTDTAHEKYPKDYDSNGKIIVYWLESGSVWHESTACSSLSHSSLDKIFCGNEEDAVNAGKERACKKCSSNE